MIGISGWVLPSVRLIPNPECWFAPGVEIQRNCYFGSFFNISHSLLSRIIPTFILLLRPN